MKLKGLFYPFTDTGASSLLPPLPWNYSGQAIAVEYRGDSTQLEKLVPEGMELADDRCSVHFFDWQSCAGDDEGYLDPIRAQYREAFVLINVKYTDRVTGYCPFIWVDNDIAIMRGLLQGYPKQLGSVWVTRSYPVPGKASPVLGVGGKFAGTCNAKDRRLIDLKVELKESADAIPVPGLGSVVNKMVIPNISKGNLGTNLIDQFVVKSNTSDLTIGNIFKGDAELQVHDDYYPELGYVKPVEITAGYVFPMAFSLNSVEYEA